MSSMCFNPNIKVVLNYFTPKSKMVVEKGKNCQSNCKKEKLLFVKIQNYLKYGKPFSI